MPGLSERAPLSRTGGALRLTFDRYHLADGKLYRDGVLVDVEPRAAALIALLASNAGRLLPNDELIATLWPEAPPTANALHYTVSIARKALEECIPRPIVNMRGKGYRFDAEVDFSSETDSGDVFVGRSEELAKLNAALQRAERDRRPAFLLVSGPPGAGKTELARRFCAQLAETRVRHVWGQCFAGAEAPAFWPWEEFLAAVEGAPATAPASDDTLEPAVNAQDTWVHRLSQQVNAPEIRRAHALEAQRKLRTIALQGPLVLVLDDLHLASEEAVELLCFLSTSSALGPVFFLATHRSEGQLNAEAGLGRLQRHAAELELGPLGPRASQQLLHAVAGNALEESVERKILETASGNPLFLRELSRSAPERSGAGADTFHVPGGIAAALERHVSVLPKQTRELLNVAAVAGQRFDVGVLASALGVTREATVKLLAPATRLDLVRPQTPTVFEFAHALYRQHLYDGMDERARRAAHLNVSHQLASGRLDVQRLGQLARHLALGASTQDELQQAATASQRAGEAYKQKHAHEPASQHFETALQLTRQAALPAADELYVALQLAECLWHSSKSEQARAVALDAVELARSAKDWVGFALAALAYGRQLVEPTADPELLAALDEALTRLPESEPSLRARLFARKAQSLYSTARVTERFDCADQALLHARRSSEPQALAAAFWARAYAHTGNLQLRINEWPKMVAAARDAAVVARDSFLTERAELYGMACAFEEGRIEESSLQAAQLEERAKTLGSPFLGYCLKLRAASLAIFRGSAARDELIADALACGSTVVPAFAAQVHFGHSLVHAWEASRAASLAQQLDAIARSELPDRSITVIAAFTWALSGERNRCLALYETCRQAPLHPDGLKLGLYCLLGEMDAWLGARQSVEVSYQRLLPFASYVTATSLITTISGLVGYSLGKLAHCLGDIPAAREHFRTARNLAERLESPPWVQRCDLALRQLSSPYRPGGPLRARS